MDAPRPEDLASTGFVDGDSDAVGAFVDRVTGGAPDVVALFAAVRDEIRYDPYAMSLDAGDYRASAVLDGGSAFCVPKAVLLAAAARRVGVPARLGFSDVRNHLSTPRLLELMGTDVFAYHGYTALHVGGAWRKASPAFNAELCARFGVPALDFDGERDALLHAYTGDGQRHMEYIAEHGTWADLPFEHLMDVYTSRYPRLVDAVT